MKKTSLLLFLISFNAFASDVLFCQDPIRFTCAEAKSTAHKREENVKRIEEKVKTDAFILFKKSFYNDPIVQSLNDYSEIESVTPARNRKRLQKMFFSKTQQTFGDYLKNNRIPQDLGVNQIKHSLIATISTQNDIPEAIKQQMILTVNNTRLVSMQSNVEESTVSDVNNLYKQCAKKSFVDNAFATTIAGQKVIMICPGEVIGTIESLRENKIDMSYYTLAEAITLGHELSHHFDFRFFPKVYQNILNFANDNRDALASDPEKYMSEITADVWGLRVFSNIARNMDHSSYLYSRIIATSMNDLCGTEDDEEHPSGDFRIERLASQLICQ